MPHIGPNLGVCRNGCPPMGAAIDPSAWGTLLQRLYDGDATPIEQTDEITGSPMTVVNDRANTGDRRELRPADCWGGDDTADALIAPGNITSDSALTELSVMVEFDVLASELPSGTRAILGEWDSDTANRRWSLYGGGSLRWALSDDGSFDAGHIKAYDLNIATYLSDGRHTLGINFSDGTLTCYLDGVDNTDDWVKASDDAITTIYATASSAFGLGCHNAAGTPNRFFGGEILSCVVTESATTAEDHLAYHESHTLPSTPTAVYWLEGGGTGSLWLDASGNGNNLTAVGTAGDQRQTNTLKIFSAANSLGHTVADGSTMYADAGLSTLLTAGTIIPRDESNPTKCVAYDSGGQVDLQYSGSAPRYAKIVNSPAIVGDSTADVFETQDTGLPSGSAARTFVWRAIGYTSAGECYFGYGTKGTYQWFNMTLQSATTIRLAVNGTNRNWTIPDITTAERILCLTVPAGTSTPKLFVDGEEAAIDNATALTLNTVMAGSFYVMGNYSGGQQLGGTMADLRIYDTDMTDAECQYLTTDGLTGDDPGDTNLIRQYPCSEGPGNPFLIDVVGGYHGVASGTLSDIRAGTIDSYAHNQLHGFDVGFVSGGTATTDYVDTTVTPNASGSVRFKGILSNSGVSQGLFGSSEAADNFWVLYYDSGGTIRASLGSSANVLVSSTSFGDGDYVDVEIFWNDADGSCSMHVNDVPEDTAIYTGTVGDNSQGADLGAYYTDGTGHSEPWNGVLLSIVLTDTDQLTAIHSWTLDLADETVLTDSVGSSNGTINGTGVNAIIPGLNGVGVDGSTATTYAPGATADKFTPDASQIDRTGGVSHPDANVNSWDASFESGDTQTNPEFVRNAAAGDDRFLAYQDTLTGDDLTSAQDYTT